MNNFYGEYGTDKFIRENFFPDENYNGVMIEVGAGPPSFISNSKHFRESGWRTICVEPNPKFVEQHKNEGSEVYQFACSDTENERSFIINYNNDDWYTEENDGVSFSSLEIRHDNVPDHNTQETITVKTIKLNTLLESLDINKVDLVSIDVEGWEIDVLRGFDLEKYSPLVVVLENLGSNPNYSKYMFKNGYARFTNLGCNEIYVNTLVDFGNKNSSKSKIINIYELYDKRYTPLWGFCTLDKAGCLIDYVDEICQKVDNPVCVEIGVYGGKSILPVALELKRNKKGIVHAIDPWSNDEATKGYYGEDLDFWHTIDLEKYFRIFKKSIKEFKLTDYVNVIRASSDDAPSFTDIDLLYIDGQHTEQALKDVEKYATHVKPGGYCLVDDVNWGEVGRVPDLITQMGFELVHVLQHCNVYKKREDFNLVNFSINEKSIGTAWVVDNFYEDPDSVRKFALEQPYMEGGIGRGFIGRRTEKQYLFPGLKERFESIIGRKITGWEGYDMNGRFQIAWSGEPLVWHCDSQQWGGMLYLTPEAPYQCGTTLYAHKQNRARTYYDKGWDAAWINVPGDPHLDGTAWEPVDVLGNVYNRLVIFDASCIHSASEYFGTVRENSRLWQMFFFDT